MDPRLSRRLFAAMIVGGVIGSITYAMTAGSAFASSTNRSGPGGQRISGFVVSNVTYRLDPVDPERFSAVVFDLDAPARQVRAKVRSAVDSYSTCHNTAAFQWSCPITDRVSHADELTVTALQ